MFLYAGRGVPAGTPLLPRATQIYDISVNVFMAEQTIFVGDHRQLKANGHRTIKIRYARQIGSKRRSARRKSAVDRKNVRTQTGLGKDPNKTKKRFLATN